MTALQYMSSLMPGVLEPKVRAHLARFGLSREKALTEIEKLSGGEKARLLFAVMTRDAPGLLILDEPTNHLDIDGREALTAALNAYAGSVILITHDLHLIELIADRHKRGSTEKPQHFACGAGEGRYGQLSGRMVALLFRRSSLGPPYRFQAGRLCQA